MCALQAAVLLLLRLQSLLLASDLPNHAVNVVSFPVGVALGGHSGLGCQACHSRCTNGTSSAGRQAGRNISGLFCMLALSRRTLCVEHLLWSAALPGDLPARGVSVDGMLDPSLCGVTEVCRVL